MYEIHFILYFAWAIDESIQWNDSPSLRQGPVQAKDVFAVLLVVQIVDKPKHACQASEMVDRASLYTYIWLHLNLCSGRVQYCCPEYLFPSTTNPEATAPVLLP